MYRNQYGCSNESLHSCRKKERKKKRMDMIKQGERKDIYNSDSAAARKRKMNVEAFDIQNQGEERNLKGRREERIIR